MRMIEVPLSHLPGLIGRNLDYPWTSLGEALFVDVGGGVGEYSGHPGIMEHT